MLLLASLSLGCGLGFFAIDQITKIGLSSLQVIYYFEKLFIKTLIIIIILFF